MPLPPVVGVDDDLHGGEPVGEGRGDDGRPLLDGHVDATCVPGVEGEATGLVERVDAVDLAGPGREREQGHVSPRSLAPTSAAIARANVSGVSSSGSGTRWCTVPPSNRSRALTPCCSAISAA